MGQTTVIRKAAWTVAWDEARQGHRYLKGADVVFADDRILHVGPGYAGPADHEIEGSGLMVMPGLINIHSHPMSEPMAKGFAEDYGNPRLGMSGLYDYMPVYQPDAEGNLAAAEVAYAELLASGVTTLVDLSVPYPGWLELIARSGLRGVLAPMFRSARWYTPNGHEVRYDWAEDGGKAAFRAALEVVDRALNHESGRLSAMITPSQVDTCTPELLKDARAAARERGVPLQIHAAQSLVEFAEMTRRHGVTPLQWLDGLGLLDAQAIVAHAIFIDEHSWITWGSREDLAVLAGSGASVAHCPTVFVRHGMVLEHFARYRAAGVNLGLGTDTYPHNMLEELRMAALLARVPQRHVAGAGVAEVFEAATLGGAKALGRDDIGRLAPGAKADIVLVDLDNPAMKPLREPLRSLVHMAAERAVRDVYVDGVQVVQDGRALNLDYPDAATRLDAARLRAEAEVPKLDRAGRRAEELAPLALPIG
jgi:cytosine/adenosine deaminase-related metal-dependent hydrolase